MELLEAVKLSTKSTPKQKNVISWKNVAKLMGFGSKDKWESEYRRKHGDLINEPKSTVQVQACDDFKKGKTDLDELLLSQLKNERTIEDLCFAIGKPRLEVLGMIEELRLRGYDIVQLRISETIAYTLNTMLPTTYFEYKHYHDVDKIIRIGIVSDTHMGSNYFQRTFLEMAYDDFAKRGIKNVYHAGDISDGFYSNRPSSIYELYALGYDQQKADIVKHYPKRDGITTHFITGNHDATHMMNGGANIGTGVADKRPDMKYLGHEFAKIWLTDKVDMDLIHPRDGTSYAYSYKMQKRIDAMSGGKKPKIMVTGHYHKNFDMFYRNIWSLSMASFQSQSPFMRGMGLISDVGYIILEIQVNEHGDIIEFTPIYRPMYVPIEEKFNESPIE